MRNLIGCEQWNEQAYKSKLVKNIFYKIYFLLYIVAPSISLEINEQSISPNDPFLILLSLTSHQKINGLNIIGHLTY